MTYKMVSLYYPLINFLNEHIIVCYDCKHIYKIFAELGCNWRGCNLDVMLAAYVVNSGDSSFSMERLVMEYTGSIIDDNVPRVVYIKKIWIYCEMLLQTVDKIVGFMK